MSKVFKIIIICLSLIAFLNIQLMSELSASPQAQVVPQPKSQEVEEDIGFLGALIAIVAIVAVAVIVKTAIINKNGSGTQKTGSAEVNIKEGKFKFDDIEIYRNLSGSAGSPGGDAICTTFTDGKLIFKNTDSLQSHPCTLIVSVQDTLKIWGKGVGEDANLNARFSLSSPTLGNLFTFNKVLVDTGTDTSISRDTIAFNIPPRDSVIVNVDYWLSGKAHSPYPRPFLSEWGRIGLILMLIATTIWVFLWRRRAIGNKPA